MALDDGLARRTGDKLLNKPLVTQFNDTHYAALGEDELINRTA